MLAFLLLLACPPGAPAAPPEVPVAAAPACVVTWRREKDPSVLNEQRASGEKGWFDFAAAYASAAIDPATMTPVKVTERFQVGGRPILWFAADKQSAVVDRDAASDLAVADATMISAGDEKPVGRFTPAARQALGDRGVVEFLVVSDTIRIYAHVQGEACLVAESTEGGVYTAKFTGEHVYFTNEENRDAMAFTVRIDADGLVSVVGG
jgi:hypothetical protein